MQCSQLEVQFSLDLKIDKSMQTMQERTFTGQVETISLCSMYLNSGKIQSIRPNGVLTISFKFDQ